MTEFEQFQQFFGRMGVPYVVETGVGIEAPHGVDGIDRLMVSESYVWFNKQGTFLGVVGDECYNWAPRKRDALEKGRNVTEDCPREESQ